MNRTGNRSRSPAAGDPRNILRLWQHEGAVGLRWELGHWENDALMTVFFLVIGLEVKRELTIGRLRDPGRRPSCWRWPD